MKKFAIVLSLAGASAFAATPAFGQGLDLGLKGGVNFAKLSGDDVEDASNRTGFAIGAFLNVSTGGFFSIQPEVLFSQKGVKAEDEDGELTMKLSYVEIPVLLKVSPMLAGATGFQPFLYAGPVLGISAGCSVGGEGEGISFDVDCGVGDFADTKSTDLGAVFGAGGSFAVGRGAFSIEARYGLGLSDVFDVEDMDAKNRTISVLVGYSIPLGM
jgi:hypothetical protein